MSLQVGTDQAAQAFLAALDASKKVGDKVDCTSAYEIEQEEFLRQTGTDLTPDMCVAPFLCFQVSRLTSPNMMP